MKILLRVVAGSAVVATWLALIDQSMMLASAKIPFALKPPS